MCGIAGIAVQPEHSLPDDVRERRDKQGFIFPLGPWLKGPLRETARSMLDSVQSRGWLQPAAVRKVAGDFEAGRVHWSRLWALVALGAIG